MSKGVPPGPRDMILGLRLFSRFQRDPLGFLTHVGQTYGDLACWRMAWMKFFLVNHPDLIREVLAASHKLMTKDPLTVATLRQIDGNGLVISEGDLWVRQRRLMQPAFHPRRMANYVNITERTTRDLAARWSTISAANVADEMTGLTLNIIARLFFDVELTGEAANLGEAVRVLSQAFFWESSLPVKPPDWLPLPFVRRKVWARNTLDSFIRGVIRERRARPADQGDLLSMLLLAVDDEGDGRGMSDEQARDEAVSMFLAGHDSTAAALAWIWWLIATHPEVEGRLLDEVQRVLGDRPIIWDDVPRLTYADNVIREALRLYPPVWTLFLRLPRQDIELGGYAVPRGSRIFICPWVTQRDPRFFPDPLKFDPERFASGRAEQIPQYAWIPFGAGPHQCIGQLLAMTEMIVIVATLIRKFRLTMAAGHPPVEPEALLAIRPRGGLPMTITRR